MSVDIFQYLAYSTMPDWLFYATISIPFAFIVTILFDVVLEKWRGE